MIVTLPPTLAGRLEYHPPLSSWRDQLTQRLPEGPVIRTCALYDEPFWRDEGLNGQAVSDAGPVEVTFDNSPPRGRPGLRGFVEAGDAHRLARLAPDERREGCGCSPVWNGYMEGAVRSGEDAAGAVLHQLPVGDGGSGWSSSWMT